MSKTADSQKLNTEQKEYLRELKEVELMKYRRQVAAQFNSETNKSTLISGSNNDMRNSIM